PQPKLRKARSPERAFCFVGAPRGVIPGEGAKRRRPGTHPATSGLADEWVPALRGCAAAAGMTMTRGIEPPNPADSGAAQIRLFSPKPPPCQSRRCGRTEG